MSHGMKYNRPQFNKDKEPQLPGFGPAWRFPFGLYRGQTIASVPTSFLILYRRKRSTPLNIAAKCTEEIDRRDKVKNAQKSFLQ